MASCDYLKISTVEWDGSRLMILSGDLDLGSVDELETVCSAPPETVELALDLSGVEFIDVVGLRTLLDLMSGGTRTRLISPSSSVRRIVSLAGMSEDISFQEKPVELSHV